VGRRGPVGGSTPEPRGLAHSEFACTYSSASISVTTSRQAVMRWRRAVTQTAIHSHQRAPLVPATVLTARCGPPVRSSLRRPSCQTTTEGSRIAVRRGLRPRSCADLMAASGGSDGGRWVQGSWISAIAALVLVMTPGLGVCSWLRTNSPKPRPFADARSGHSGWRATARRDGAPVPPSTGCDRALPVTGQRTHPAR